MQWSGPTQYFFVGFKTDLCKKVYMKLPLMKLPPSNIMLYNLNLSISNLNV